MLLVSFCDLLINTALRTASRDLRRIACRERLLQLPVQLIFDFLSFAFFWRLFLFRHGIA